MGLAERVGVPKERRLVTPAVFVGNDYLIGADISREALGRLATKHATGAPALDWDQLQREGLGVMVREFLSFGLAVVSVAGLIDGLNPCAFATMIFLVSYLAVAKRKGRELVLVGAAFTAGVFLAYTAIGVGFLAVVRSLPGFVQVAHAIYLLTGVGCLVLAAFNVRDYVRIRRGGLADMTLQLPGYLKDRVRARIRGTARVRNYVLAAFVSGVIISVVELVCTGQVYLPTIVFVVREVPELHAMAFAYLAVYNVMFVVPLIAVFIATYYGTTSRQLTTVLERRAGLIKLLMAGVFVALAAWLIVSAI
jgi:hypothetical protein